MEIDCNSEFETKSFASKISKIIKKGSVIALNGDLGSGKTTLLRLIYMDLLPQVGNIIIGDYDSDGIKHKKTPPAPIFGDTYSEKLMQIPQSWDQAIQSFENSEINRKYYPKIFRQVFGNCKKQELETFNARIEEHEITTYLEGI